MGKEVFPSALKAVVEEIAETYKVSRQSAAIRVSELGYPEAVELYDSEAVVIDRQHRRGSTAAKFHQQPIDEVSAFRLYMSNEFLKATLDTGASCYAEGYFVLRDEKYVLAGEDALFLTEYARLHLSECTLDFSYKLVCSRTSARDVQYMFRADTEYKKLPSYDSNTQNMDEYNKALEKSLDDVIGTVWYCFSFLGVIEIMIQDLHWTSFFGVFSSLICEISDVFFLFAVN